MTEPVDRQTVVPRIDVSFPIVRGEAIPRDHGYAVFSAINHHIGGLHQAPWFALLPTRGMHNPGEDTLVLTPGTSALRCRVMADSLPRLLPLSGKVLDIGGHKIRLGVPNVYAIHPAPSLRARLSVIKGHMEPDTFETCVRGRLRDLNVNPVEVVVGKRRAINVHDTTTVGFELFLRGLGEDDSILLQYLGMGGKQRMGCGVLIPGGETL